FAARVHVSIPAHSEVPHGFDDRSRPQRGIDSRGLRLFGGCPGLVPSHSLAPPLIIRPRPHHTALAAAGKQIVFSLDRKDFAAVHGSPNRATGAAPTGLPRAARLTLTDSALPAPRVDSGDTDSPDPFVGPSRHDR